MERIQSFSLYYCSWNGALGGGSVGRDTDIVHHSLFFYFFGLGFSSCISFSASLKTWQLGLAGCDMFIPLLDSRSLGRVWVGWLRSKWPSRDKQQSAPKHIRWLKEEPRQEEGMGGDSKCKTGRGGGVSQQRVGWNPDRGKVKKRPSAAAKYLIVGRKHPPVTIDCSLENSCFCFL